MPGYSFAMKDNYNITISVRLSLSGKVTIRVCLDAINTLFYLIILNCMHDGNFAWYTFAETN